MGGEAEQESCPQTTQEEHTEEQACSGRSQGTEPEPVGLTRGRKKPALVHREDWEHGLDLQQAGDVPRFIAHKLCDHRLII